MRELLRRVAPLFCVGIAIMGCDFSARQERVSEVPAKTNGRTVKAGTEIKPDDLTVRVAKFGISSDSKRATCMVTYEGEFGMIAKSEFHKLQAFRDLKKILVVRCRIDDGSISELIGMPALNDLALNDCILSSKDIESIPKLSHLSSLVIAGQHIPPPEAIQNIGQCRNLSYLYLSWPGLSLATLEALQVTLGPSCKVSLPKE